METLILHHNCIKSIPDSVLCMQSLTFLDLSRNDLSEIPSALFRLPLEVLLLQHNRLQCLPIEIAQTATTLMQLDLSCNSLSLLPMTINKLTELRVLNVRHNLLTQLPTDLRELRLMSIDLSYNKITHLPHDLRFLCCGGAVHILKWLQNDVIGNTKRGPVDLHWTHAIRSSSFSRTQNHKSINDDIRIGVKKREDKRRTRGSRYNTVGGDSGYSGSMVEDNCSSNRLSQDLSSNGSSEGSTRRSPIGEEGPPIPIICSTPMRNDDAIFKAPYPVSSPMTSILPSLRLPSCTGQLSPTSTMGDKSLLDEVMSACSNIQTTPSPSKRSPLSGSPTPKAGTPQSTGMYRPTGTPNGKPATCGVAREKAKLMQHDIYAMTNANISNGGPRLSPLGNTPCSPISEHPPSALNGVEMTQENDALTASLATVIVNLVSVENHTNGTCPNVASTSRSATKTVSTPTRTNSMKSADIQKMYTSKKVPLQEVNCTSSTTVPVISATIIESHAHSNGNVKLNANAKATRNSKLDLSKSQDSLDEKQSKQSSAKVSGKGSISHTSTSRKTSLTASSSQSSLSSNPGSIKKAPSKWASNSTSNCSKPRNCGTSNGVQTNNSLCKSGSGGTNRPLNAPPQPPNITAQKSYPVVFKSVVEKSKSKPLVNQPLRMKSCSPVSLASTNSENNSNNNNNAIIKLTPQDSIRKTLRSRLGVSLPENDDELMLCLSDGVYLCNFVNSLRARSIPSVHAPSPALPVLSPAKCRRNVENFLMACRRLGVPEALLCTQVEVLDKKDSRAIAKCLTGLNKQFGTSKTSKMSISTNSARISHV